MNELTGAIPQDIFNISSPQTMQMPFQEIFKVPTESELQLLNLKMLFLADNNLIGNVPPYY